MTEEKTSPPLPDTDRSAEFSKRDSETQIALGLFVTIISIPVLIGTLWAGRFNAAVVNAVSGAALMCFGLGMAYLGFSRRPKQ